MANEPSTAQLLASSLAESDVGTEAQRTTTPPFEVRRIQSSYVQVAEQLRQIILRGDVAIGQRFPPEPEMASLFGVSRSTIREALRILVTDGLLETKRGVQGGTFVAELDGERVEALLNNALSLLAQTQQASASDFLEAWKATDVPAARLAARRRLPDGVAQLERTSRPLPAASSRAVQQKQASAFHAALLRLSGNVLLEAMGRAVSTVARANFALLAPTPRFWTTMTDEHRRIYEAVAAGDEAMAQEEAARHVDALRPLYEQRSRR